MGTRAEQQAERRARVIGAALKFACAGGYEAVQMRTIAREADVALGTIYRYFASKDLLLLAVLDQLAADMEEALRHDAPAGATALERIGDVIRRSCAVLESQPLLAQAVVSALIAPRASDEPAIAMHDHLKVMMKRALQDEPLEDLEGVTYVLGLVWLASLLRWVGGQTGDGSMEADLNQAAHLLLAPRG